MSFKVKAYMSIAGDQNPIPDIDYSNCSKLIFKNDDIFVAADSNYFRKINLTVTENNSDTTNTVDTLHIGNSKLYTLATVHICDLNKNVKKSLDLSFGEEGEVVLEVNDLVELGLTDGSQIYINFSFVDCDAVIYTKPDTKYLSNPKIISYKNGTVANDYIAFNNTTGDFWICENRPSGWAVNFENWHITLYQVTKDDATGVYNSESLAEEIYSGPTHNIEILFWHEADSNSFRNESNDNLIKSKDFKNTDIYSTYLEYLNAAKSITDNKPFFYFVVSTKCVVDKTVDFHFMKNGGEGINYKKEWYYGIDLRNETIKGFSKEGYTFDGFYINNGGYGEEPPKNSSLGGKSDYSKIVNSNCSVIPNVKDFSGDECQYINIILNKHGYANYIPNQSMIILNWNLGSIDGNYISIDGKTYHKKSEYTPVNKVIYETYDETCDNISITGDFPNSKVYISSSSNGSSSIPWTFKGFYTKKENGTELIDSEGIFKRNVAGYTESKKWKNDSGFIKGENGTPIILYAKWVQGGYIELDKDGNAPTGYHGDGGNNSFSAPYKTFLPSAGDFYIPALYDDNGNKDADMNFKGYYTLDASGNYNHKIIDHSGMFILYTSVTDGIRRSKLQGLKKLYAYWYGDKFTIRAKSSDKDLGTVKDNYQRIKKNKNVTIEAIVNDSWKYAFQCWKKEDNDTIISESKVCTFTVLNSGTYIANFGIRMYKINYKDYGDVKCTAENIVDSSVLGVLPNNPYYCNNECNYSGCDLKDGVRKGYKFLGWYTDSNCTNKVTQITADMTKAAAYADGTITLYANWERISDSYTVYFDFTEYFDNITTPPYITVNQYEYLSRISDTYIPFKTGYTFTGYKDENGTRVIDRNGYWIKNTLYCDNDGNCIMSDALDCVNPQTKSLTLYANYNKITITDNIEVTQLIEITKIPTDFVFVKDVTDNKIANINWINHAFGFPEQSHYSDNQKHYYINDINEDYNYNKVISDEYFTYDFDCGDTKCLKQIDIFDLFKNKSELVEADFYLRNITYDNVNKKTTLAVSIKEKKFIQYTEGYNGIQDVVFYININNNIYKINATNIFTTNMVTVGVKTIDVDLPDYFSKIDNITIEHVPCFAIRKDDNTTYYKQHINFYTCVDKNEDGSLMYTLPTITQNTLLENVTIGTYTSALEAVPDIPGVGVV